jgi:hypothetical protein
LGSHLYWSATSIPADARGLRRPLLLLPAAGGGAPAAGGGGRRSTWCGRTSTSCGRRAGPARGGWHSLVITSCSGILLRRGLPEEVLRVLLLVLVQLLESSSVEFACSALLRRGFPGSWKPESYRTRPKKEREDWRSDSAGYGCKWDHLRESRETPHMPVVRGAHIYHLC